ncbi:FKBP-type peptidyl-prolyl cis-trans isomerase [Sphingorhabdus sp. 109]|jgi:FKBP-type peptidyl-prolyl cis-trans isomerase|uniref:FKBP-type peptidyl-prolyl cis-trans isomerase n=1 Tax=Sphingorhabdus sp. 109 TaxID=2653173 RepID=UPI0012F17DDF|nr:FKBP-type peptidyl-prolyl cis-trans isomerase [Sphingorhabdus sp. 109]VWX61373.1 Peptidyl-prolyl cis-trans isomerase [Sphingorhabdus sp. 109]
MSVTTVPIHPIKKGSLTKIWIGVLLIAAAAFGLAYAGTQSAVVTGASNEQFLAANAGEDGVVTTESGLQYKVITPGEGPSPVATDTALVKYEGQLRDGTVFDANEQAPMPVGAVVPGFSEALQLMQKGGEYRIWIPSELAYGEASPGEQIPPNSLLIFDVTLIDFISQAQMEELRQQMQAEGMPGGPPPSR